MSINFKRPTKKEVARAAGENISEFKNQLTYLEQAAFSTQPTAPSDLFRPVPRPGPSDWLSNRQERGQSWKSFHRRSFKTGPHGHCTTLEVVPLGNFDASEAPDLMILKQFMEAYYYGVTIRIIDAVKLSKVGVLSDDGQLLVPDAMKFLRQRRPPRDVFAQIAITMVDITPGDGWNFVYGQASLSDGVGIFSFARYSTNFWREVVAPLTEEEKNLLLKKSCKTMAHEVGHIFGLRHCIYFHCIMNGNNGDEYAPLLACPICLRKLMAGCGGSEGDKDVDVRVRYERLLEFYSSHGWERESGAVQQRLVGLEERVAKLMRIEEEESVASKEGSREGSKGGSKGGRSSGRPRRRRVLGARVNLGREDINKGGEKVTASSSKESSKVGGTTPLHSLRHGHLKKVKVIAPRGVVVRERASKNSKKILTLRAGADLYVSDPPNFLRTSSGTVRVETSIGWTTSVTSRGMPMVDI